MPKNIENISSAAAHISPSRALTNSHNCLSARERDSLIVKYSHLNDFKCLLSWASDERFFSFESDDESLKFLVLISLHEVDVLKLKFAMRRRLI